MTLTGWLILLAVVVILGGLAFWGYKAGFYQRTVTFLQEVRSELKKVSFPSREEVTGTTIVVLVTSVIFAIYLWMADFLILRGYEGIIKAFQ